MQFDYPTLKNQPLIKLDKSVFKKSFTEQGKLFTMKKELGKSKLYRFITMFKGSF